MNNRPPGDDDDLIRLYREAADLDVRAPSQSVGDAVRAHARAQDAVRREPTEPVQRVRLAADEAANTGRWRWSMVAGLAVFGLAGLLVLQFDDGTPQEKQLARGPSVAPPAADTTASETAAAKVPPPAPPLAEPASPAPSPSVQRAPTRSVPARPPPAQAMPSPPVAAPAVPAPTVPAPLPFDVLPRPTTPGLAAAPGVTLPDRAARSRPEQEPSRDGVARESAGVLGSTPEQAQAGTPLGAATARARLLDTDADLHHLAAAGAWRVIERQLAAGALVDSRDGSGRTPLMWAAEAGQTEMVRRLLRSGADLRLTDHAGRTAASWAQQSGRDDIVRLLDEARKAGAAGR